MSQPGFRNWLLLLPQIPPHPSSLRVRVWRRLQQIGAVAVKGAAYALPDTEETLEDFTWLRQEIVDAGGGSLLLRAEGLGGADDEIRQLFREERDRDYRKLAEEAATLGALLSTEKEPEELVGAERTLRQLRERLEQIRSLDFFGAAARAEAELALTRAEEALQMRSGPTGKPGSGATEPPRGALWVTRAGVYVDRLACAWIIRRFLDPEARFAFVRPEEAPPAGALPFDMAGVEFGHHGTHCSAETLALRFRPEDRALQAVAEVVHDLDLKDAGFGRPEAAGFKRLLDGVCARETDDSARITAALPLFEALYAGFE